MRAFFAFGFGLFAAGLFAFSGKRRTRDQSERARENDQLLNELHIIFILSFFPNTVLPGGAQLWSFACSDSATDEVSEFEHLIYDTGRLFCR